MIGKKEVELMGELAKLSAIELVGIAKLMEVDKEIIKDCMMKNDWEDMVVDIVVRFGEKNRRQKRDIFKFIKKINKENAKDANEETNEETNSLEVRRDAQSESIDNTYGGEATNDIIVDGGCNSTPQE